ncbi:MULTISPECIES: hypothetical protein [Planktothricoides]|nr:MULTISPECIES: hypothetical protein [Planktothricoides]
MARKPLRLFTCTGEWPESPYDFSLLTVPRSPTNQQPTTTNQQPSL